MLTPGEASFRAFQEFADELYKEQRNSADAEHTFQELANALEYAAPWLDSKGNFIERRTFLSKRWSAFLEKYEVRRKAEIADRNRKADEVKSHKFSKHAIDAAWSRLSQGEVPDEAVRVWRAAYPRKSAHQIADEAEVSLKDCIFWVVVFREHHIIVEEIVVGTHLYSRSFKTIESFNQAKQILTSSLSHR